MTKAELANDHQELCITLTVDETESVNVLKNKRNIHISSNLYPCIVGIVIYIHFNASY